MPLIREEEKSFRYSVEQFRKLDFGQPPLEISPEIVLESAEISSPSCSSEKIVVSRYISKSLLANEENKLRTLIWYPGNAFVSYPHQFDSYICATFSEMANCQVISIGTRPAPEHPFPIGLHDACAVLKYLLTLSNLRICHESLTIAGYSSGANFALTVALLGLRQHWLQLDKLLLFGPVLNLNAAMEDIWLRTYSKLDPVIKPNFVSWFLQHYFSKKTHPAAIKISKKNSFFHGEFLHMLASPLLRQSSDFSLFAKKSVTFSLIVGTKDYFLKDAVSLVRKLNQANVILRSLYVLDADHTLAWRDAVVLRRIAGDLSGIPISRSLPMQNNLSVPVVASTLPEKSLLEEKEELIFLDPLPESHNDKNKFYEEPEEKEMQTVKEIGKFLSDPYACLKAGVLIFFGDMLDQTFGKGLSSAEKAFYGMMLLWVLQELNKKYLMSTMAKTTSDAAPSLSDSLLGPVLSASASALAACSIFPRVPSSQRLVNVDPDQKPALPSVGKNARPR